MSFFGFHSVVERWFRSRFESPTEPQESGWPHIAEGKHTLIAAPTGSGKTLTAFLGCIDRLLKESLRDGLPDEVRVVYVSPLRALSNDMHRNLEVPLQEINALVSDGVVSGEGSEDASQRPAKTDVTHHSPLTTHYSPIRAGLRTGDTTSSQRAALVRRPPQILVTTPESLYLMLTAPRARETLRNVDTVIVDEIHTLVRDKRGSHLALSLERLDNLTTKPLQRIGLSATQKPIERTAAFLVGSPGEQVDAVNAQQRTLFTKRETDCTIVDVGHQRELDLAIETPPSELGAVCTHEQWAEVNERLVQLVESHNSTLIFVNTRRLAERLTHQLTELLGEEAVSSHHGSLSAPLRLQTERRLKNGQLKAVVATASLELGIDVGYIDLVVQIGSPRAIATFLQRIGRSGHSLGLIPKGRIFALSRDELLESMALMRAVNSGRLDAVKIPEAPLDVLAQQIVAEVSTRDCGTDELFHLFRRAYPYRELTRENFDRTVEFLSEGVTHNTGRSRVYLHHDHVRRRLRARKGARIPATANAGAIPETFQFRVVAEPDRTVVGSVDEDFAVESMAGDIFLLGNTSWRILNVRGGDVNVVDAHGAPPTIPFWFGEAPGRTIELSEEVSRLREELERRIGEAETGNQTSEVRDQRSEVREQRQFADIVRWLREEANCSEYAARQAVGYAAAQKVAVGLLPTQKRIVFERFFDESGGMQLVVHAPFGGEINRAWGLAMRKRFCRSFDFELQATADDDGFILSLGPQHSFPIESLFPMLTRQNARGLLEQAVLAVPMFELRWRWNVTRSLLVLRRNAGKKVPPAIQRFRSEDLLTAVFPRLTGCQEEHVGDIPIPDHPLVQQTMKDCLTEAVDIEGLNGVLEAIERGEITLIARDTREPSPFSYELLNANPYAFLDGGEIQERRTRAVSTRRSLDVESADDLGRLDPEAIAQVRAEAQPPVRNADELHDLLISRIVVPVEELTLDVGVDSAGKLHDLAQQRRAAEVVLPDGRRAWIAAERLPAALSAFPELQPQPAITAPPTVRQNWERAEARTAMIRGLVEISGPITAEEVARRLCLTVSQCNASLEALEGEGLVLRGRFSPELTEQQSEEWREGGPGIKGPESREDEAEASSQLSVLSPEPSTEWCHRRLLARIHRLTLHGLRRQIEPVTVDVFQRFLFQHHGIVPERQRAGTNGLYEATAMLQGIDAPAVAWERDLLPMRIADYKSQLLDELCLSGEIGWGRMNPIKRDPERGRPMASLTRVAPISLFLREDADWLLPTENETDTAHLSGPAQEVCELLRDNGALFATDLLSRTRMLPAQLDEALGELVTRGLLTADGFGGLRKLIGAKSSPSRSSRRRGFARKRQATGTIGRWSLRRAEKSSVESRESSDEASKPEGASIAQPSTINHQPVEQWAWQLLRRWGVIFRDILNRESCAPRWYELLQVYRRLEARGEIRGGRFITGVAGEQFAVGDTVRQLRQLRTETNTPPLPSVRGEGSEDRGQKSEVGGRSSEDQSAIRNPKSEINHSPLTTHANQTDAREEIFETIAQSELIVVSAADPLNLVGIITEHPRVPSTASNRIAFLNGRPVARLQGGTVEYYEDVPAELRLRIERALEAGPADRKTGAASSDTGRRGPRQIPDEASRRRPQQPSYPSNIPRPRY